MVVRPGILTSCSPARRGSDPAGAGHHARSRYVDRRERCRPRIVVDTARHLNRVVASTPTRAPPSCSRVSCTPAERAAARTDCASGRTVHGHALHDRRDGRQQRLRVAGARLRRTADNVAGLRVAYGEGDERRRARRADADLSTTTSARAHLSAFSRQVSGTAGDLLPESGRRLDRFLVGSEGTLASCSGDRRAGPRRAAAAGRAGLPDDGRGGGRGARCWPMRSGWSRARDWTPDRRPGAGGRERGAPAAEGRRMALRRAGRRGAGSARGGWRARAPGGRRPGRGRALWRIREDGAGLAAAAWTGRRTPAGRTPPSRPSASAVGCGIRGAAGGARAARACRTATSARAACTCGSTSSSATRRPAAVPRVPGGRGDRAAAHGGSLSGEHGDGRARSELLPLMYDQESLRLFAGGEGRLRSRQPAQSRRPGRPAPLDADLRPARPRPRSPALRLSRRRSLADAVHRCTGVGKCVAPATGGAMCPSYLATRDEKDSTRGRARVFQEALDGSLVTASPTPQSPRRWTCACPARPA